MDFEEFDDLFHRKEENVINLKYSDLEEENEDKEQDGKKHKNFDFDSEVNSFVDEASKHDIVKKVLRGDVFHQNQEESEFGDHTDANHEDTKSIKVIKKRHPIDGSHELLSDINGDISPPNDMRVSRKNIGTFNEEFDKQQIRQIIQELNNPQERMKMCLIDVKQQTEEELLKEINEATLQGNPQQKRQPHHQRRGRLQTVIGIPNQVQMYINQQELLKHSEHLQPQLQVNKSIIRQTSNHSTSNNMTSQSSMHTLNLPTDKDKFGSGERGGNNQNNGNNNNIPPSKAPPIQTQQFFINKNMFNSQDEFEGKQNANNQAQGSQLVSEQTFQQKQKFNKSDYLSHQSKTIRSEDSNLLISMRIDNIEDSQLTNHLQTNVELLLQDNNDETTKSKNKNISLKLMSKQTSIVYHPTKEEIQELEENIMNSAQFPNIPNTIYNTPYIGNKGAAPISQTLQNIQGDDDEQMRIRKVLTTQNTKTHLQSPSIFGHKITNTFHQQNNDHHTAEGSLKDIKSCELNRDSIPQRFNHKTHTQIILNPQHKRQSSLDLSLIRCSPGATAKVLLAAAANNPPPNLNVDGKTDINFPSAIQSNKNISQTISNSVSLSNHSHSLEKHDKNSQGEEEKIDAAQTSVPYEQTTNINEQAMKFLTNKMRQHRSNTVFYDQDKYLLQMKKYGEMNPNHNHVVKDDIPQEGCVACDLQQLMKQHTNVPKEKPPEPTEVVDTKNLYKEIPLHVIESRFFLRQLSLLKYNEDNSDKPFVMGYGNSANLKLLRVYFFNRDDTFIDVLLNMEKTTVIEFVKFCLLCYKQKSTLNKNLLKYPDQPSRYKIFPNQGGRHSEIYKPMETCEPGDNMNVADTIEESSGDACCLIEVEDIENDHEEDLKEFQQVYAKSGQLVFKVECKEKEYYTFIRIAKEKSVDDIFEDLMKKKKIDIDRRNFMIQAKIHGYDTDVELDLKMPLTIINDHCLKVVRREYEDRQGGTMDDNKQINTNNHLVSQYTNGNEDSMNQDEDEFDDEDDDDDDLGSGNQLSFMNQRGARQAQLYNNLDNCDPILMTKYEEFEVMKVTYISNEVFKKSKRIIGIDENHIYNRKVQPNLFSLRGLLCFLFPASPYDTKCPQKRIDDIKFMCIVDGGNLLIQFIEKDVLKQWLLYNPNPSISKKMYQKLSYLRKTTEVRIP